MWLWQYCVDRVEVEATAVPVQSLADQAIPNIPQPDSSWRGAAEPKCLSAQPAQTESGHSTKDSGLGLATSG